ncbi:hypothetical protein LCGC14_0857120 [marine sediment metagenome]|uniref:Uncharacterized protein n=1 Tax=marine sediment metagenome TaxID=412755 RepID=A0A0F9RT23_9ZZZZ
MDIQNELREVINEDIKAHGIGHTLTSVRDGIQDVSDGYSQQATTVHWDIIVSFFDEILRGPVNTLEGNTKNYHEYCHPDVCAYRRKQLGHKENCQSLERGYPSHQCSCSFSEG